jgi:HD-GYP domain-containing protein (c-di-GMP phosphodiesterase class II)
MKLVQISPETIPMGEPLPFALHTEDGTLLANKGVVIRSRPELDMLREKRSIFIEPPPAINRAAAAKLNAMLNTDTTLGEIAESQLAGLEELRPQFNERNVLPDWPSMQVRANWVLRDVHNAEAMTRLRHLHHDLSRLTLRNPDASLLSLMHLSTVDTDLYSATHSLLVSVMCLLAARDVLGWNEEQQMLVSQAALTMNYAMTELQDKLARQVQRPDPLQQSAIDQHPEASVQLLQHLGVTNTQWLDAVFHHHDAPPGPLRTRDLSMQMARLIQRADVFAARLAPRATRAGLPPPSAMQAAYFDEKRQVDEAGAALIKAVGIYPPGSYVKLINNEVAAVVRRGANTTTPKVAVLINKSGIPTGEPIIRNTGLSDYRIAASLPQHDVKVRIDLNRLLNLV